MLLWWQINGSVVAAVVLVIVIVIVLVIVLVLVLAIGNCNMFLLPAVVVGGGAAIAVVAIRKSL